MFKLYLRLLSFVPSFFLMASCSTVSYHELEKAPASAKIFSVIRKMNNTCFISNNPQFLTEIFINPSHTNFQLEGVWKDNFQTLNMQVLGVLGEQLVFIELNEQDMFLRPSQTPLLNNPEIRDILLFLSSLGPVKMREIFCGTYAFPENKLIQNNIFLNSQLLGTEGHFFTTRVLATKRGQLQVESDIALQQAINQNEFSVFTKSTFLYGIFKNKTHFILDWKGNVNKNTVTPKNIGLGYEEGRYEIKVLDYD